MSALSLTSTNLPARSPTHVNTTTYEPLRS